MELYLQNILNDSLPNIKVHEYKFDKDFLEILCYNDSIEKKLIKHFSIEVKGAYFKKSKCNNQWNGKDRLIKKKYNHETEEWDITIPRGLWYELYRACKQYNIKVFFKFEIYKKDLDFVKIKNYIDDKYQIKKHIKNDIRDFQYQCIFDLFKYYRICAEAVPASGKSLIMYIACRMMLDKNFKTLVIVPNVALCEQLRKDFIEYGFDKINNFVQIINGEVKEKNIIRPIVISTWQTFQNVKNLEWVDLIIADESDLSKNSKGTKKLQKDGTMKRGVGKYFDLIKRCNHKKYLLALTGTMPNSQYADYFQFIGNTGKHQVYTTEKMLEDLGQITKVKIVTKILNYTTLEKKLFYSDLERDVQIGDYIKIREKKYFIDEKIDFEQFKEILNKSVKIIDIKNNRYIVENDIALKKSWVIEEKGYLKELRLVSKNEKRLAWLLNEVENTDNTTMILFSKKSKEGYILRDYLEKHLKIKKLVYIDGNTKHKDEQLNIVRNDKNGKIVLLAAVQVIGRGVTIKNLQYGYNATSFKSPEQTRQFIGRFSRLCENKEMSILNDIVDNYSLRDAEKLFTNNSTESYLERKKEYSKRGYEIVEEKINL